MGKAAEGGCQRREASNALCIDEALDAATSAGTPGRERLQSGAHLRGPLSSATPLRRGRKL